MKIPTKHVLGSIRGNLLAALTVLTVLLSGGTNAATISIDIGTVNLVAGGGSGTISGTVMLEDTAVNLFNSIFSVNLLVEGTTKGSSVLGGSLADLDLDGNYTFLKRVEDANFGSLNPMNDSIRIYATRTDMPALPHAFAQININNLTGSSLPFYEDLRINFAGVGVCYAAGLGNTELCGADNRTLDGITQLTSVTISAVPVPAALPLFLSGLLACIGFGFRRTAS